MNAYNFDRYLHGCGPMAMGVRVHAESIEEAVTKANAMINPEIERLLFSDNDPCVCQCQICYPKSEDVEP